MNIGIENGVRFGGANIGNEDAIQNVDANQNVDASQNYDPYSFSVLSQPIHLDPASPQSPSSQAQATTASNNPSNPLNPSYSENANGQYDFNGISQDPSQATGYYPTEQAAQDAWYAAHPQYKQYDTNSAQGPNTSAGGIGSGANSVLPSTGQIGATAPVPIQAFGGTPQVSPTYGTAAGYDPSFASSASASAAGYDPAQARATGYNAVGANAALVNPQQSQQYLNQAEFLNAQALAPQFQSQNQSLQDQLASRGISSSGSAQYLTNQLYGQQASALAAADSPLVSQGYGYSQADIAANQANRQQTNLYNSGVQNTANQYNASNLQNANQYNAGALNSAGQFNAGNQQQANLFNAGNQQQTNLYNAGAANTAGQYDASNQQQQGLANQSYANAATSTNAGYYNQDRNANANAYNQYLQQLYNSGSSLTGSNLSAYLNSFGPNTGVQSLQNTGLGGTQNTFNSVYGQAFGQQGEQDQLLGQAAAAALPI